MAKLQASVYVESGEVTLLLNGQKILRSNGLDKYGDDEGGEEKNIPTLLPGYEYVLQWFAEGEPGSSFSITISSPREAEFHLKKVLGATGKEFGGIRFTIQKP